MASILQRFCYPAVFLAALVLVTPVASGRIVGGEFYLGTDPGEGNGTALSLAEGSSLAACFETASLSLDGLTPGTYDVGVRVRDDEGRWSNPIIRRFTLTGNTLELAGGLDPNGSANQGVDNTSGAGAFGGGVIAEYFLGTDPGEGNGTALSLAEGSSLAACFEAASLSLEGLTPGTYDVGVRVRDDEGRWSNPIIRRFTYTSSDFELAGGLDPNGPANQDTVPANADRSTQQWTISLPENLEAREYLLQIGRLSIILDVTDPSQRATVLAGLRQQLISSLYVTSRMEVGAISGDGITLSFLEPGRHADIWISSEDFVVSLDQAGSIGAAASRIVAAEYFFNVAPLPGNGIAVDIEGDSTSMVETIAARALDITSFKPGTHAVGIRFRNAQGHWGNPVWRRLTNFSLFGDLDLEPPVLTLNGPSIIEVGLGAEFIDPGASALDAEDGDLSDVVVLRALPDTTLPGEQVIEYAVADLAGNVGTIQRTVIITAQPVALVNLTISPPPVNGTITGNLGTYQQDQPATLNAVGNPGYLFTSWSGDASGSENPLTLIMDADKEISAAFDKDTSDPDGDNLSSHDELVLHGTDPNNPDSDGDGFNDGDEINAGTNPNNGAIFPNLSPVFNDQEFTIEENSEQGSLVGTFSASDPNKDGITFTIIEGIDPDGDGNEAFRIEEDRLLVNDSGDLDYENTPALQLTVNAGDGILNAAAVITVQLGNLDDARPLEFNDQSFSIAENSNINALIGRLNASSPDADAITYAILPPGSSSFRIDDDRLLVLDPVLLDFETISSLEFRVRADDGQSTADAFITVSLIDIRTEDCDGDGLTEAEEEDIHGTDDCNPDSDGDGFNDREEVNGGSNPNNPDSRPNLPPVFTDQSFTIVENRENGTEIATLNATDRNEDEITYRIVENTDPDRDGNFAFRIEGNRLLVNDSGDLDYESDPVLRIVINASDGKVAVAAVITVKLLDDPEDLPPVFDDTDYSISRLAENGTLIGTLNATDPDGDPLSYSILNNTDPDKDGNPAFRIEEDRLLVNDSDDLEFQINVIPTAAGAYHTLAVQEDGTVTAWGRNDFGQVNLIDGLNSTSVVSAGLYHNMAQQTSGKILSWGLNDYQQSTVPEDLKLVIAIAAGGWHSMALQGDGQVRAWGRNNFGQTTVPENLGEVRAITAGTWHSMALLKDGTIRAWGNNNHGQRDVPAGLDSIIAIAGGAQHSLALREDGIPVAWGRNNNGQSRIPEELDEVTAIAAGGYHNLALKKDGSVVAWGNNEYGQSSVPENLGKAIAISAGGYHSIALQEDGQLVIWGRNDAGQANPPEGIRIAKPGIVNTDSLEIVVRASNGTLTDDAVITINLNNAPAEDSDGDGLPDAAETNTGIFVSENDTGTDPTSADTDGDGFNDGEEVQAGSDPNDASSTPDGNQPAPLTLNIRSSRLPSGAIQSLLIRFDSRPGKSYRVEESANMKQWRPREEGIQGNGQKIERSIPALGETLFLRVVEEE